MKKCAQIILVGLLSLAGNWAVSCYQGIPVAYLHDEFSYLLAADTFAHGRITNPPHPLWQHFETFHELMQPTYMSKYPPGQGFFMAVGQVLGGHPIYGVWLSAALMCMAVCWMLYAWVPSRWAFIGGLVSVLQFGVFTYWTQSYWGGAVAALGGALVFGAAPRVLKYQRTRDVIWLGLGIAVLANTRPFEGIIIGLLMACLVLPGNIKWKNIIWPFILVLSLTAFGMGAYNKAVTGRASLFPYSLYLNTQMAVPLFIWEPLRPMPAFKHQEMRDLETALNNGYYRQKRTWQGFISDESLDAYRVFMFYFGYILALPILFFLPRHLSQQRRGVKFILVAALLLLTCAVTTYRAQAHYYAPFTGLAVLLVVLGLRSLRGLFKQKTVSIVYALLAVQLLINGSLGPPSLKFESYGSIAHGVGLDTSRLYSREEFKDALMRMGGKHLVLINYAPHRLILNDWAFNGADIDGQQIVWARSMDAKQDAGLIDYFKDRRVWRVTLNREISPDKRYDER